MGQIDKVASSELATRQVARRACGSLELMCRQLTGPGTLVASPLAKEEGLADASVWANGRTCIAKEGSIGSEVLILREWRGAHELRDNDGITPAAKEGRLAGVDMWAIGGPARPERISE